MVHVTEMGPPLGAGLPKSPSFHKGLAYAGDNNQQVSQAAPDSQAAYNNTANAGYGRYYSPATLDQYQPLQPLLVGKSSP